MKIVFFAFKNSFDSLIISLFFEDFDFLNEYSVETNNSITSKTINTIIYQLTGVSVGS